MENLSSRLVSKSIEAFILGLEIYNKPTIRYRIEGFSFFICNAWELMLKAHLINKKGYPSIYYKNQPGRTINISETVAKVYPDKYTRVRLNLEKIIELRNISTHFITEDYEPKYAPLFQACTLNYTNELNRFHSKDITKYISQNFLTINAFYEPLTNEQIKLKYPPEIAEKLIAKTNEIEVLSEEYASDNFAIQVRQNLYITRSKKDADFSIRIDKSSEQPAAIIKELKDPSDTHKYSHKSVVVAVQERLKKKGVVLNYKKPFNSYVLNLFIKFYNAKIDSKFSYKHVIGKQEQFTYSEQFIEFIVDEICKNPETIVESLDRGVNEKR